MADLKYQPEIHDHTAFVEKAKKRAGFKKAYDDLEEEYALVRECLPPVHELGFRRKL